MADDFDYEGDEYDDDWLYVEDVYALADELVETQIADPGYAGNNDEVAGESYEYDFYDYWVDLDYLDDAYWDTTGVPKTQKIRQKRKRDVTSMGQYSDKRRKGKDKRVAIRQSAGLGYDNVVFMSPEERARRATPGIPLLTKTKAVAFLPDWRARFANKGGETSQKDMPVEMQQAAETQDDDWMPEVSSQDPEILDEDDSEDAGLLDELGVLDPDTLKAVLKQRLGEAGLEGLDEAAFMSTISKMLAGNGEADEAAGELANSLLGQVVGDESSALSGWLSGQGVSLNTVEDDDASSVATVELSGTLHPLNAAFGGSVDSPSDSAISMPESTKTAEAASTEVALHPRSANEAATSKAQSSRRRVTKRVTFDVSPSVGESGIAQPEGPIPPTSTIDQSEPSLSSLDHDASDNTVEVPRQNRKRKAEREERFGKDLAIAPSGETTAKRTRSARTNSRQ